MDMSDPVVVNTIAMMVLTTALLFPIPLLGFLIHLAFAESKEQKRRPSWTLIRAVVVSAKRLVGTKSASTMRMEFFVKLTSDVYETPVCVRGRILRRSAALVVPGAPIWVRQNPDSPLEIVLDESPCRGV